MSRMCSLAADKLLICPSSFVASSFFITGLALLAATLVVDYQAAALCDVTACYCFTAGPVPPCRGLPWLSDLCTHLIYNHAKE
jgi:hypothetical protein